MERGLLWLPLLALFVGLAWAGWAEYQKIETYQRWAADFDQAKYDLYSVLGYRNGQITYGKATRQGVVHLKTVAIASLQNIFLQVDQEAIHDLNTLPSRGKVVLILETRTQESLAIPFTQIDLAAKWVTYLRKFLELGL
ncbi:hypothetical protein NIES970_20410 [[Synechococcus] sp. NIES-970]|uniref:hypothetical protein n=1 Tax=Picosynechococcus sp. NKBG15041c TaxID=1407650 RepID=UPI00041833F5|nr:hypothetical protein [Picosynechococcus sp. NKBG15041c]BAW97095.1 hypothetical protein NIES970_20410 [[Synechococcus] sp. NIES-970]